MLTSAVTKSARRVSAGVGGVAAAALLVFVPVAQASEVSLLGNDVGSSLQITGDPDADLVSVNSDGTTITITDTGAGGITSTSPECTQASPTTVTCPADPPDPAPDTPIAPVESIGADMEDGNDSFATNAFNVVANGGGGNDTLTAGTGSSSLNGDAGDDSLTGGSGDLHNLTGGDGNDTIQAGNAPSFLVGMDGNDSLTGGPQADDLDGGSGDDTLLGGAGSDVLADGGGGSDTGGTDHLDGQGGSDSIEYNRSSGVNVSLDGLANDGFAGENDNVNVDNVTGSGSDDVLTGDAGGNGLFGADGNDQLRGLDGVDLLEGAQGVDLLDGGGGKDDLNCGSDVDLGLVQPNDVVAASCERVGAELASESTRVAGRKNIAKVRVLCPAEEGATCAGSVRLVSNGKTIGSGAFSAAPGTTGVAKVKINRKGRRALARNGDMLLVTGQVTTDEPGGVAVREDEILVRGNPRRN